MVVSPCPVRDIELSFHNERFRGISMIGEMGMGMGGCHCFRIYFSSKYTVIEDISGTVSDIEIRPEAFFNIVFSHCPSIWRIMSI